ncbi:hypothetical protein [Natranaerobius trueperi]|uniref:Restriction endonuclease n=1 Tax=Natranaerobius trueperi TaxID=759412 RepID=A0A226BXA7_9FIRM|nr:hypothetical protein [Natranaerobius trueperi]OWZ82770.1 hypothetical protein CDO51_12365 [Natranaerobius trueperi]
MDLFENKIREYLGPAAHSEDTYNYLDRSARKYAENIRCELNKWFSNLPEEEKEKMKRRFTTEYHSAFFELFLHEFFSRLGFSLTFHPEINGTTRRPDFLVENDKIQFLLEATVNTDLSNEEEKQEKVKQVFYDEINKIESPNCYLRLVKVFIPKGVQPSGRKVRNFLENKLKEINIVELENKLMGNSIDELPTWKYKDEAGVLVEVQPFPKSEQARGKEGRPIGIYPIEGEWDKTKSPLYNSLVKKAKRYGNPNLPYIIAVNSLGDFGTDLFEIMEALFGTVKYHVTTDGIQGINRAGDGLFHGPDGPQYTRVSGVIVSTVTSNNLANASLDLFHNPWAKNLICTNQFSFFQYKANKDVIEKIPGLSVIDVLGLPKN